MINKWIRRIGTVSLAALLIAVAGCTPAKYTRGVSVDRKYPDDVLPIYDGAVVFEYENDDNEEFKLSAGTSDRLDDVVEFYQDYFNNEGILLSYEEEDDDEYVAEGVYDGYAFELTVGEPRGEWEDKLYRTVMKIILEVTEEPEVTPEPTSTPEPTPTSEPIPDMSEEIEWLTAGTWYQQTCLVDGQSVGVTAVSLDFYTDLSGCYTTDYQTDPYSLCFNWEIAGADITYFWPDDTSEVMGYTLTADTLSLVYSMYGSRYMETYTHVEPVIADEFTGLGAWVVTEGDYAWQYAVSFWPDGTGWLWWVDLDTGEEYDYFVYWYNGDGVLDLYLSDWSYYHAYTVLQQDDSLDLDNILFTRADDYLAGTYYMVDYVTPDGEVVEDTSIGITLYADGTGSSYNLDDNEQKSNITALTWYLTEQGTLMLNEDGAINEYYYHLQNQWLSLCMVDEYGLTGSRMWFKFMGD